MQTKHMAMTVAFAPIFFIGFSITSTLFTSNYDSLSSTMSKLAGPGIRHSWIFQSGVIGYALFIQFLIPLLRRQTTKGWLVTSLSPLVVIYGLAGILAAIFRDGYGTTIFWNLSEDAIHGFMARLSFSAILILVFLTPLAFRDQQGWHIWRRCSLIIGIVTTILVIPFQLEIWPSYLGLIQRIFFFTTMLWIFITSIRLGYAPSPDLED